MRIWYITGHIMCINPEFNLKVIHCLSQDKHNYLLPPSERIFHKSVKFWKNTKDGIICFLY